MRVSVIIPNYNRAAVIGETVQNMLSQSLPPYEVIVVDDGSTDDSVEVIRHFGNHVTLIQQSNQGPGAARNAGLKVATGEFIQFMDSDDLASLNKLEVQAKVLKEQNADIVYGPWVKAWMSNQKLQLQDVVLQQKPLPSDRSTLLWFLSSWSMVFQQCLLRKSLLDRVGGYREDLRLYEDGELFVRMLLGGAKLVHEAHSLTLYRLEDHGKLTSSGSNSLQKILDKAHFFALVIESLSKHNEYKPILQHSEVSFNIWRSLSEFEQSNVPDVDWIIPLQVLAGNCSSLVMRAKKWSQQKISGLQYRLTGHRWHRSYQPSSMTEKQEYLIRELGFDLL